MPLLEPLLVFILGLVGLLFGSHWAVGGALRLAEKWGWPAWVAGILLLALGTSLPELFVVLGSLPGYPQFALATVMGSNGFNVGIVLGLLLLLLGDSNICRGGGRWGLLSLLLLGSFIASQAFRNPEALVWPSLRAMGICLIFLYAAAIFMLFRAGDKESVVSQNFHPLSFALFQTLGGFALLAFASGFFLDGSLQLAARIGWTEGFAGFFIAAVGTSSPELFTCWQVMRKGHPEAVYGNILGSNLFNLLLVGGLVAVSGATPDSSAVSGPLAVNAGAALALVVVPLVLRFPQAALSRATGAILLLAYFYSANQVLSG